AAGLREECDVRGVARAGALLDRVGEVGVRGVGDRDAGVGFEVLERGEEGLLLLAAEGAEDAHRAGAGGVARGVALDRTTTPAARGAGVLQASGHPKCRGGRGT